MPGAAMARAAELWRVLKPLRALVAMPALSASMCLCQRGVAETWLLG